MLKSKWTGFLTIASMLGLGMASAHAAYPDRPVHIIVGYTAGGSADNVARLVGQKLSEKWGQPVVVENREGADGTIAEDVVAHSKADGYTIALVANAHTISASQRKLSYDPVKDFEAVTQLGSHPDVLVINPTSLPVKSLEEFIALAKKKPGQINYVSGGTSTPIFLEMEELKKAANFNVVPVVYRGGSLALVAALSGETPAMFASLTTILESVKAGKLTAIAVSTSRRAALLPDVPTVAEAAHLSDFQGGNWEGLLVPAGTPKDIVDKIYRDSAEALKSADLQARFANIGYLTISSSPAEFDAFIKADIPRWDSLFKSLDVK